MADDKGTEDGINSQLKETAKEFVAKPAVVQHVNIEGYWRTKKDILVPGIKQVLEATNFRELLTLAIEAKENLQNLGVFSNVDLLIDTSSGPSAHPNGYDITFQVKEKHFLTSSTGTKIGNNEGNMLFGSRFNNVFGRAEQVKADLSFGTRTRMSYQLAFFKPTPGKPERSFTFAGQLSTTDVPMCSHQEASQGLLMDFVFSSIIGQHSISWEGVWRDITGLSKNASFAVRDQAGHSVKSALKEGREDGVNSQPKETAKEFMAKPLFGSQFNNLFGRAEQLVKADLSFGTRTRMSYQHAVVVDRRDNLILPTKGYFLKLSQELAGLGGDVIFFKNSLEYQQSFEILKDVILSWTFQGGNLRPLFGTPSRIHDRFFLGGPLSVREFNIKGIGPRSENDFLGADTYWAAGLHLYTPLPFRPGRSGLGDRIKAHLFFNCGSLVSLDTGAPWRNRLDELIEKVRWSYGAGLVFMLGNTRVELNYCVPFGAQSSDSVNHGIQVGVGINFL